MLIEEIDETNFIEKNEEGRKRIELKIKRFERQVELSIADSKKSSKYQPSYNKEAVNWNLLHDPTLWAYKFFKDKHGNKLTLRGFQDKILNDQHRFIVVVGSNQIGKTFGIAVKAIQHATLVTNASVLIVSYSEQQAIYILDEIKAFLTHANIEYQSIIGEVENRTELRITNYDKEGKEIGFSVIRCLPPTHAIRGFYATLIICDEIAFWDVERMDTMTFFNTVIVSRTLETKNWKNDFFIMGQVFCISNPNGQQGVLWKLWKNPNFNQYRYNFLANPSNTLEEYLKLKSDPDISSFEFDSVYAATFSSATGGFILQQEFEDAVREYIVFPPENVPLYFGGDFAGEDTTTRDTDYSILIAAIREKENNKDIFRVVHLKEFPLKTKKDVIYDELLKFPDRAKFAYDKVGVGDSVRNDLIEKGILTETQIEALTYSLPNKSDVYYNMKRLFEKRRIIIPNHSKLKEQLLGLRFKLTEGGHMKKPILQVHHERSGLHDDLADALANACWAARFSIPVEVTFVPHNIKYIRKIPKMIGNKGDLLFCLQCKDYHWTSEPHKESLLEL